MLLIPTPAAAAGGANDASVRTLLQGIYEAEYQNGKFGDALEKLEIAKIVCEGDACSAAVRAELHTAIATVQVRLGNEREAQQSFSDALREDPNATLATEYENDDVRRSFEKARKLVDARKRQGCGARAPKKRAPRGWKSASGYFCYREARKAEKAQRWSACIEDARASHELETRATTRALLAGCLDRNNRWEEAISEYQEVARRAPRRGLFSLSRRAAARARQLQRLMPTLLLQSPKTVDDLRIKLDGTLLPLDVLDNEMPLNPGVHKIEAKGTSSGGLPLTFEQEVDLKPRKTVTVLINLSQGPPEWATRKELKCLLTAKGDDAIARCLGSRSSKTSDLSVRIGSELSVYHDTMNVDAFTPAISTSIEHVTEGWGVGAAVLVDVVTAASVDILATASPRWREVRWVPAINGHKRFDPIDVSVSASLSHEPDYISGNVSVRGTVDLRQKTVTPSLGYSYSHDINGRVGTRFDVFSHDIDRHALDASVGLILTKATFGSVALTFVHEDGDTSKPYRHIPLFDQELIENNRIPPGLNIKDVNVARLPERPLEQLPTERQRYAIAAQLAHRFSKSTLRASERMYLDSWGIVATTTDARYLQDISKRLRIWPHFRFHAQTGADFYQLAYGLAGPNDQGEYIARAIRTGDRELGPLYALTAGGGARLALGKRRRLGLGLTGDVMYTRFLNHLFVVDRWGYFGALTFDVEFE